MINTTKRRAAHVTSEKHTRLLRASSRGLYSTHVYSTARQRLRPTGHLYRAYLQVVLGLEALDGDLEHLDGLDRVVAHGLDLGDG